MNRLGFGLFTLVLLTAGTLRAAEDDPPQPAPDARREAPPAPAGGSIIRRDPFRPFTLDLRAAEKPVQLTPLQRYELGELAVVATIWELSPPRAMVEDGVGMGYIVTLGTPIGHNGGIVTAIEPARVVVEEHELDFYGKEQVNRIVMETPKEEGPNRPVRERK